MFGICPPFEFTLVKDFISICSVITYNKYNAVLSPGHRTVRLSSINLEGEILSVLQLLPIYIKRLQY